MKKIARAHSARAYFHRIGIICRVRQMPAVRAVSHSLPDVRHHPRGARVCAGRFRSGVRTAPAIIALSRGRVVFQPLFHSAKTLGKTRLYYDCRGDRTRVFDRARVSQSANFIRNAKYCSEKDLPAGVSLLLFFKFQTKLIFKFRYDFAIFPRGRCKTRKNADRTSFTRSAFARKKQFTRSIERVNTVNETIHKSVFEN